ncbi:MAG: oligosaccharide flippase family protein [Armatimonadota bacterium]
MSLSRGHRVIRDTSYLVLGQMLGGVVGLVAAAWFARNLPSQELSMWPVCVALVALVAPFTNLGMPDALVRSVPKLLTKGRRAEAARMMKTGLLGMFLCTAVMCVVVFLFAEQANRLLLKGELPEGLMGLIVIAVFVRVLESHLNWFLNACQEYKTMAGARMIAQVLRNVGALVLYVIGGIQASIWGLTLGSAAGCIISAFGVVPHLRHGTGFAPPWDVLKEAGPFYLSSVYRGALSRVDYILVGALGGAGDLALYYVAYRVIEYLHEFDTYIMETLTPKLAEKSTEGRRASEQTFTRCTRYYFLVMLPLHLTLAALGPAVIRLYAGGEYASAGVIFSVLCVYLLLDGLYALYRRHILVTGNRWHMLLLDATEKTLSLGLIAVLTVHYAGLGAAVGRLTTVALAIPLGVHLLRRTLRTVHSTSGLLLGAAGALLGVGLTAGLQLANAGPLVAIAGLPIAVCLYLVFLRRRLRAADVRLVTQLVPTRLFGAERTQRIHSYMQSFYLAKAERAAGM